MDSGKKWDGPDNFFLGFFINTFISAEYKDIWTVENRTISGNQVKASFMMQRKELTMSNVVVEDFLQESIIMKQFNHPNVLSLIGVSVHNDKPCIILPLMRNGDLNSYLTKHKEVGYDFVLHPENGLDALSHF